MEHNLKDLNKLYGLATQPLLNKYASNKYFFTQKEFEEHYGEIMSISSLRWEIEKEITKKCNPS